MYPFHARTAGPISTKFCTDLHTNSGKVLSTCMTPPTRPPDPGVPQTPKPQQVTGEKTLCNKKCPDGWRKTHQISRAAPGPGWQVKHKIFTMQFSLQKFKNMLNSTNSPSPNQNFGKKICEAAEKKIPLSKNLKMFYLAQKLREE